MGLLEPAPPDGGQLRSPLHRGQQDSFGVHGESPVRRNERRFGTWYEFAFWLKHRIESPRFRKVEHYGGDDWGYYLRVESLDDLDDEVQEWLCMAYEVGCQQA